MKKILFLSFYFEPDLSACSFRNSPLAFELAKQLKGIGKIDVITTSPNRYSSFISESSDFEEKDNLSIKRITIPKHTNGFFDQILAFKYFYFQVKKIVKRNQYDLIYASSSRLFTSYLAYKIAAKNNTPLYIDIRDVFSDSMNDVISSKLIKLFAIPALRYIENKVFSYALHINLISAGFEPLFKKYQSANYSFFTNGIDELFIMENNYYELLSKDRIVITYAGNIGEGQGLHKIIPQTAQKLGTKYFFRIIGDGGAIKLLEKEIELRNISNVSIEKPVKRTELIEIYKRSHFLFLHLNDYRAYEKVLPSKIFEYGAFPRPIIAGVNGYAKSFLLNYVQNVLVFEPANFTELAMKIEEIEYNIPDRTSFIANFKREFINKEMAMSICNYL